MREENTWTFPCPNCGSSKRVIQAIVDEDKEAGLLGEAIKNGATRIQKLQVVDGSKQPKVGDKASGVTAFFDFCEGCGTEYCYKVVREIIEARMDVSHLMPPYMPPGLDKKRN